MMESKYNPSAIETEIYKEWESHGWFSPGRSNGAPYSIILPPPNVTGHLHMGHAFQATLMDILSRYHRMCGYRVLWQPGTDHAGIATQMVVERQLAEKGIERTTLGREKFLSQVWQWRHASGGAIQSQFRRLGASLDWTREMFTLDPGPAIAVTETFVRLFNDGLIYRGKRLVNWDPTLETALSDLEVVNVEEDGSLWHIRYPFAERPSDGMVIATTRPETLLGDVAVAVHPQDDRYRSLIGKKLQLPLTSRKIPIIADEHVDPTFGTGCVKVTPAHDFHDYLIGERHELDQINILDAKGHILPRGEVFPAKDRKQTINIDLPESYVGQDRFEARRHIVADLDAQGLLIRTQRHRLRVPRGDRSGAILEPWLTNQWFVDLTSSRQKDGRSGGFLKITKPAMAAVRNKQIQFIPTGWEKTYFNWLENIQDWCISRQLWWGHRIPAWYGEGGQIYVASNEAEARRLAEADGYLGSLRQDEDVLDTWFSSALWPLTTLGWPEETKDLKEFYPTSALVTGFDIIFFWVARMVMMGLYLRGDVPFKDVHITGLIRDEHGQKMSKSKGNVLDPIDLIDGIDGDSLVRKRTSGLLQPSLRGKIERVTKATYPKGIPAFGTDALRFTFAALASHGHDINFDLGRIAGYRNFCNKLWNATRFVLLHVPKAPDAQPPAESELEPSDRWIRSRLAQTISATKAHIASYRFDLAAQALYDFTWVDFCDWYLEMVKHRLVQADVKDNLTLSAQVTLIDILSVLLRLLHPFIPFITEALWAHLSSITTLESPTIMLAPYPSETTFSQDAEAEIEIKWLQTIVTGLRTLRSELGVDPARRVSLRVSYGGDPELKERIDRQRPAVLSLVRATRLDICDDVGLENAVSVTVEGTVWSLVDIGVKDIQSEINRIDKAIAQVNSEHERLSRELENQAFLSRAPAEVVQHKKERLSETKHQLESHSKRRAALSEKIKA